MTLHSLDTLGPTKAHITLGSRHQTAFVAAKERSLAEDSARLRVAATRLAGLASDHWLALDSSPLKHSAAHVQMSRVAHLVKTPPPPSLVRVVLVEERETENILSQIDCQPCEVALVHSCR